MHRGEMRNPYKIVAGQLQENKLHEGQRKSERMIFELILKWLSLMVLTAFTDLQESLVVGLVIFRYLDFSSLLI
jgi:hypothetical protein